MAHNRRGDTAEKPALYPGITAKNVQEEVGWPLRLATKIEEVSAPSAEELRLIREELDPSGMYR